MYVKSYRYRLGHLVVWFEDDGKMLDIMALEPFRKGLLICMGYNYPRYLLADHKELWNEWEELPYEPCFVAIEDEPHKTLNLNWGFYQDKELTSRTRKRVVPLDCLMDFFSDYLNSHEDYTVIIADTFEIHGGATHHMTTINWMIVGSPCQELSEITKRYLSEVL